MTDTTTTVVAPTDQTARRRRVPDLIRAGCVALVILPVVTSVIRSLRTDWFPIGDNALLYIRARDVWTAHHPLLGSWTSASLSFGENVNNPGSMYDWLIAPWAHLMSPGPAAAIGVAVVNIACIVGISIVSRRVGGWGFERVMLVITAVLAWSMGSELLIDIWQANALVLPFVLCLLLLMGLGLGDGALLPWTAAVATLLVQTHVSYAYILSFLALGTVAAWVLETRRNGASVLQSLRVGVRSKSMLFTVGVIAVLWAQPLYEEFFVAGKGNITRLIENSGGGEMSLGPSNAARIVAAVGVLPTWWARNGYTTKVPISPLVDGQLSIPVLPSLLVALVSVALLFGALIGLRVLAVRRSLHRQVVVATLMLVGLVGMLISLSILTIGPVGLSPHHIRWVWPLIAVLHAVLIWMALSIAQDRRPDSSWSWLTPVAVALIVVFTVANLPFRAQRSGPVAEYARMPVMREMRPGLDVFAEQMAGAGPVLFDVSNVVAFEPYSSTMMMWLQERGIEFHVADEGMVRQLGPRRQATGTESVRLFQLQGTPAITYDGPACPIAVVSALSVADEARAAATLAEAVVTTGATPTAILDGDIDLTDIVSDADRNNLGAWAYTSYGLFADGLSC